MDRKFIFSGVSKNKICSYCTHDPPIKNHDCISNIHLDMKGNVQDCTFNRKDKNKYFLSKDDSKCVFKIYPGKPRYICDINILSTDKKKCYPIMLKIGKKGRKPDRQCRKQAPECL